MFKRLKNKITFAILVSLLTISTIASGAFVYFKTFSQDIDSTTEVLKVAKNMTSGTEYYKVHEALEEANDGDTVVIHPGSDALLFKDAVVKTGVTLAIPIEKENIAETAENGNSTLSYLEHINHKEINTNRLFIKDNITLTVNGTLAVYGQMSAGSGGVYNASFTTGKYASLNMGMNSKLIVNKGKVNCFGFIYEVSENNGSYIELNEGNITIPVNMRDFKGGNVLSGYYRAKNDRKTMPFDQMAFPNVHATLKANSTSKIIGTINLAAGGTVTNATQLLVGNTSDAFLQFGNSKGYFEAKYNKNTEKSTFKFYSDITINKIKMEVSAYGIPINIDSSEYFYSVSWRNEVEFLPAKDGTPSTVNFPYMLLFLPGSSLKIHRFVTANFSSKVSFLDYQDFRSDEERNNPYFYNDTEYTGDQTAAKYCNELFFKNNIDSSEEEGYRFIEANFINNGVVNATELAGRVKTEIAGSILKVTSGTSVTTQHLNTYDSSNPITGFSGNVKWISINNSLRGQTTSDEFNQISTGTYLSDASARWVANDGTSTISFDKTSIEIEETETTKINITASGTYTIASIDESIATISSDGTLHALKVGTTTIVAQCGTSFAYCSVNVISKVSLTVNVSSITIKEGNSYSFTTISSIENVTATLIDSTIDGCSVTKGSLSLNSETNEYVTTFTLNAKDLSIGTATIKVVADTKVVNIPLTVNSANTASITAEATSLTVNGTTTITSEVSGPTTNRKYDWSTSASTIVEITTNNNSQITITAKAAGNATITLKYGTASDSVDITVTSSGGGGGCVLGDTLVTMWDGTQKKVQDLLRGDIVMSFDHELGTFVGSPLLLNAHAEEESRIVDVLTLRFSNGESIDIAYNHGFYDLSKRNYVTVDNSNVDEYIGDEFYYYGDSKAILEGYDITSRCVKVYAPFAYNTFNVVANGFISVPGVVSNFLVNIYEYDENMKINEYQTLLDIDRYGLFTYEDLAIYANKDMFDILKLQYLKIGIGKGLYTMEDVIKYLEYYSKYF